MVYEGESEGPRVEVAAHPVSPAEATHERRQHDGHERAYQVVELVLQAHDRVGVQLRARGRAQASSVSRQQCALSDPSLSPRSAQLTSRMSLLVKCLGSGLM